MNKNKLRLFVILGIAQNKESPVIWPQVYTVKISPSNFGRDIHVEAYSVKNENY